MRVILAWFFGAAVLLPLSAFADGVQQYASPGSYTFNVPANSTITVYVWGGGGGGSGTPTSAGGGGGGGGGGFTSATYSSAQLPSSVTVTVGSGGTGGNPSSPPGQAGGTSSFGSYLYAYGGQGGPSNPQDIQYSAPGGSYSGGSGENGGAGGDGPSTGDADMFAQNGGSTSCAGAGGGGGGAETNATDPNTGDPIMVYDTPMSGGSTGCGGTGGNGADITGNVGSGAPQGGGGGGGMVTIAGDPSATWGVVTNNIGYSYASEPSNWYQPNVTSGGSGGPGQVYITWTTAPSAPVVSVTANGQPSLNVPQGTNYTVAWSSSNASSCTLSWQGSGPYLGTNGSQGITPNQSGSGGSAFIGTYTFTCSGPGGQSSAAVTITDNPPVCNISISPNPSAYAYTGTPVRINWSSTYSDQVYINNIGWVTTSGSTNVASQQSTSYNCVGYSASYGYGSWTNASLTVNPAPAPSITISANPTSVAVGQSSTITATFAAGSGDALQNDTINIGSTSVIPYSTATTRTYVFTPSSAGTTTFLPYIMTNAYSTWSTYGYSVNVTASAPPSCSFSASPTSIMLGSNSTITWSCSGATSCTGSNFSTGRSTSGSVQVTPTQTTTYGGSCSGAGGTTNFTPAKVTVSCTPSTVYSCSSGSPQNVVQTVTSSSCGVTVSNPYNGQICTSPAYCSSGLSACQYPVITETPSGTLTGNLQVLPNIVKTGERPKVYWNISNAQSCSATSTAGDSWTGLSSGSNGVSAKAVTATTKYFLWCRAYGTNSDLHSSVTVTLAPLYQEQ